jgi:hypothetical protein
MVYPPVKYLHFVLRFWERIGLFPTWKPSIHYGFWGFWKAKLAVSGLLLTQCPASGLSVLDVYYIPDVAGGDRNFTSGQLPYSHPRSFRQYTFQAGSI